MQLLFNILIGASIFFGLNKTPKCKDFKTGQFVLVDSVRKTEYLIERNDSVQIETDIQRKEISAFKIHWLSDCEYQLNILEGPDKLMNFYKDKTLNIKILETYTDGYMFEGSISGYNFRYVKTIKIYNKDAGDF